MALLFRVFMMAKSAGNMIPHGGLKTARQIGESRLYVILFNDDMRVRARNL
jgi:hypothetical protein